jgi:hypothetical protein
MNSNIRLLAVAALALCFGGCAASSVKQTWKSPAHQGGPVGKIAVVAVDERSLVRQGFENRFVRDFRAQGQEAAVTHDLLGLPEIKADKEAAAARLRSAGADSVLIVRLVDQNTYNHQVRATSSKYAENVTDIESYYGWYDYYTVAFTDMTTIWSSTKLEILLDTSLYDLKSEKRLWSALTKTVLKDDTDRLAEADLLVAKVVAALRKDGMVR